ncbi:hypothetical protein KUV47_06905 [Vannielia litorea]|uniref:hypothetical protein n=1 Tax=Vannielia litorea TaxID=1217970 RepID=UPI001C93CE04|nr:hypothetical protein [Vannielia litorea]MBY6152934.1 hypothetical protein [Vannielia litorea]
MLRWILAAVLSVGMPGLAVAQESLPCDRPLLLGGAEEGAEIDKVHRPVAHPGAFGGTVSCVQEQSAGGVEQYWVEFLPENGTTQEHVTYLDGLISYHLKFKGDEGGTAEVAACSQRNGGGLVCRVDLGSGKGLYLARFFGPDLGFTGIRVMAYPGKGIVNETLWNMVSGDVEAGTAGLEMELILPEKALRWSLRSQKESRPGEMILGMSGDPAWEFMREIYEVPQEVVLEARVTSTSGGQETTTTATQDIAKGNVAYLIDKLAKVEQLMVAGWEKSKGMKF